MSLQDFFLWRTKSDQGKKVIVSVSICCLCEQTKQFLYDPVLNFGTNLWNIWSKLICVTGISLFLLNHYVYKYCVDILQHLFSSYLVAITPVNGKQQGLLIQWSCLKACPIILSIKSTSRAAYLCKTTGLHIMFLVNWVFTPLIFRHLLFFNWLTEIYSPHHFFFK